MNFCKWIDQRQLGMRPSIGDGDQVMKRIYSKIEPYNYWNNLQTDSLTESEYGSIFNLEFSPEGNILAAACERRAIVLFDAISQKQTQRIMEAHADNVNYVKFLDNRTFATCSDDTTVAIWDTRFLKKKVRSLQGHSNWVKNIEYSVKDKLLVTSGFDGSIFTWDINCHTEEGLVYQKVFNTSGLMRCRISPDGNKMVISTTGGYFIIIHHLDLTTLQKDLSGFRPSVYRLMQMGNQFIPNAAKFDHLFSKSQKKNRVELVSDFPVENDAEIILSLQVHPQGLSFLSRNTNYDEKNEWTCIHDINEELYDITVRQKRKRKQSDCDLLSSSNGRRKIRQRKIHAESETDQSSNSSGIRPTPKIRVVSSSEARTAKHRKRVASQLNSDDQPSTSAACRQAPPREIASPIVLNDAANAESSSSSARTTGLNRPNFVPDIWAAEITVEERAARQARQNSSNTVAGYDFVYAISSGIMQRTSTSVPLSAATAPLTLNSRNETSLNLDDKSIPSTENYIFKNAKKLMYYIEEPNGGKGFIKELCFSSDGRIISSPYNNSVRLLSYSEYCSEHPRLTTCDHLKKCPKELVEVKKIDCHTDIVLCTSFSPTLPLLVTGCKLGKVTWHYPCL